MNFIKTNYLEFLNEAGKWDLSPGYYFECGSNFKGISPVKGKIIEVIDRKYGVKTIYKIKFIDGPVTIKDSGVVTDTIEINENQIRGLIKINKSDYLRKREGFTLKYEASDMFKYFLKCIKFRTKYNYYDASYFEISDEKNDMISFLPAAKSNLVIDKGENPYESKYRQETKVGRILKKLNDDIENKQLEDFVYNFKATWNTIKKDYGANIKVVTGDDITYWYHQDHYNKGDDKGGGSLNSSCMRYPEKQNRVKFYSKFPNKIALCILLDNNNKLLARALVWRLDEPANIIFMDRIYYVKQEHEKILEMYAIKNNMHTKLSGYNHNNHMKIYLPREKYTDINELPYLDTFMRKDDYFTNK